MPRGLGCRVLQCRCRVLQCRLVRILVWFNGRMPDPQSGDARSIRAARRVWVWVMSSCSSMGERLDYQSEDARSIRASRRSVGSCSSCSSKEERPLSERETRVRFVPRGVQWSLCGSTEERPLCERETRVRLAPQGEIETQPWSDDVDVLPGELTRCVSWLPRGLLG